MALLSKESTIIILVKLVAIIKIEGAKLKTVTIAKSLKMFPAAVPVAILSEPKSRLKVCAKALSEKPKTNRRKHNMLNILTIFITFIIFF